MFKFMIMSKHNISVFFIFIFHIIGAVGLLSNHQSMFLFLTPFHLLLMLSLCFVFISFYKFYKALFYIFCLGFLVELIGVKTGFLFGDYQYGSSLGFKIWDVPLIIGVNWIILVLGSRGVINYFVNNNKIQIVSSAVLMVFLDFIIEPVAILLDFWSWSNGIVPIQNYIMWFIVAIFMQNIISKHSIFIPFKLGSSIILSQFLFFIIILIFN